ncbi:MAG: glutathione peroxidase [Bacteroidota bacterium]
MKTKLLLSLLLMGSISAVLFSIFGFSNADKTVTAPTSLYQYKIKSLDGKSEIDLSKYKGKKLLLVNVASECGFTKQYKDLQALHKQYGDKLVVIGFPCNQFGEQEPGGPSEIATFCEKNFGVTFPLTEKINVKDEKGQTQHPIYAWLTNKELNGKMNSSVKWNFQKYLIDENGNLVDVYYSMTNPMSDKITKQL